ncbi:MAG: hypothetical protein WKG01_24390 [Kofleriaceae bacterium]
MKVLVVLVIAGCASTTPAVAPPQSTPRQAGSAQAGDPACPVAVAGTSVTVEDAPGGASLVFVTTGDVADVRRRASAMAKQHNDHHGKMGPLPDGSAGSAAAHDHAGHDTHAGHAQAGHGDSAGGGMIGVHSNATTTEIDGGATILFTAGAADVAKLQGELRMHAQHLGTGSCGMAEAAR